MTVQKEECQAAFIPASNCASPLASARAAAVASWWDEAGEVHTAETTASNGWLLGAEYHEPSGITVWTVTNESGLSFALVARVAGERMTVNVPRMGLREAGKCRFKSLRLLPGFGAGHEGDEGYLVIPQQAGGLCHFHGKEPAEVRIPFAVFSQCTMPFYGAKVGTQAYAARLEGGQFDANLFVATAFAPERGYSIDPEFMLRDVPNEPLLPEDLSVHYRFWDDPSVGWQDMGREYREFNRTERGLVPLAERRESRPELGYAADALEIRIRLGVKPVPHDIREQTPENEPDMRIFMTFDNVRELVEECARQGVGPVQFCLVGWNIGGHDGRYPQIFPVEERLGGEAKLRETIARAQKLGYQIVAHDCYTGAYRIAEDWDEEYIRKMPDGELHKGGQWGGGQSYNICQLRAVEAFASRDLPRIRDLGFRGLHYSDVISIVGPRKCYDPRHPQTRRQDVESRLRLLALARETIGGVQSEGSLDWSIPELDSALYCEDDTWAPLLKKPYIDERVPLYPLVYHGIVLYNLSHKSVNATPGTDGYLRNVEYGGRPLVYYHGHFMLGGHGDWLGDRDFRYEGPERLVTDVATLKSITDDYRQLAPLQNVLIEDHRELSPGLFETAYANGSRVLVNYNETPQKAEGITVPVRGFTVC
ncbi:MAG: DUF5696 domain-containing protein [Lentisphaeria bacterium]|jgi:hypothetical protein|nr:DUF5696 domain-containing protein [Lentisphaeria bacterium]